MVSDIPCEECGNPEGDFMLVCEWCGAKSAHLACLGLAEVPDVVWCCSSCVEHKEAAQAADDLDGRWVLGKFQGGIFWGRLSSVGCYGLLSLRYSDGELYEGVRVAHVLGHEALVWHHGLELQPAGCEVPADVLSTFDRKGWLV
jgi:hypothetical protein